MEEHMLTGTDCLRNKIARKRRVLASLAPLFMLALLLAWMLSSEEALSYFQSPTSPPSEETPLPTEVLPPTEAGPTMTPSPGEEVASPTEMPLPTEERSAPASSTPEAPSTVMVTSPPVEELAKPSPSSTKAVLPPVLEGPVQATEPSAVEPSEAGGAPLWPWGLLGVFSLGAMAAGVFLLRREVPGQDEENQAA
jgi:hypothetical protein